MLYEFITAFCPSHIFFYDTDIIPTTDYIRVSFDLSYKHYHVMPAHIMYANNIHMYNIQFAQFKFFNALVSQRF